MGTGLSEMKNKIPYSPPAAARTYVGNSVHVEGWQHDGEVHFEVVLEARRCRLQRLWVEQAIDAGGVGQEAYHRRGVRPAADGDEANRAGLLRRGTPEGRGGGVHQRQMAHDARMRPKYAALSKTC